MNGDSVNMSISLVRKLLSAAEDKLADEEYKFGNNRIFDESEELLSLRATVTKAREVLAQSDTATSRSGYRIV